MKTIIMLLAIAAGLSACAPRGDGNERLQEVIVPSKEVTAYRVDPWLQIVDWKDPRTGCHYLIARDGTASSITPAVGQCQPA